MTFRRIIAYLIDIIIISLATSMLAGISYLNPSLKEYEKANNEYMKISEKYIKEIKENNKESINNIKVELEDATYKIEKTGKYYTTINIVLTVLYFAVFQMLNHGQTLGKKLMKIKIDGNLNIFKYIIRTAILHNVFINFLKIVLILTISKEKYILASNILSVGALLVEVTIIVMVSMRNDKRGLHDIITGSNVVRV